MTISTPDRSGSPGLDPAAEDLLFRRARTVRRFAQHPVPNAVLERMWDLARMAPTANNGQPLRLLHVRTDAGRARLLPHVAEANRDKVTSAPVTTVLAADLRFHEHLPTLFPPRPELRDAFEGDDGARIKNARFNATLQIGYVLLAARAVGLVAGPMAGFDSDGVTAEFLRPGEVEALLLVNLGRPEGDPHPRLPRLAPDDVVAWA